MDKKSIIKFPQYLASNDLKDVYFQKIICFLASCWRKNIQVYFKLGKNRKTALKNRRNKFAKIIIVEKFQKK